MDSIIEEFTITLKYQVTVNTETGEMNTKCIKRTIDKSNVEVSDIPKKINKKSKKEENSSPELILEDNKYCLNSAAIELMKITSNDKLDIKYEKNGNIMIPVIGTDEIFGTKGGNRISKNNTIVCRGSKNEELSKYGKVFSITPHPTKENLFILKGDSTTSSDGDENIKLYKSDDDFASLDLSSLIDEKDTNIEEINSSYFKL